MSPADKNIAIFSEQKNFCVFLPKGGRSSPFISENVGRSVLLFHSIPREMSSDLKAAGLVVVRKLGVITDEDLSDIPITAEVSTNCQIRLIHKFPRARQPLH